jgi:Bacterial Ig domain
VLPAHSAAPVAVNNTYTLDAGSTLVVAAAQGVSANDTLNGNVIQAVQVTAPAHGALTLNPDGSFTYVPQAAYSGDDSFTYRLRTVPGPLDFIIQQTQSRIQIDAKATTSAAGSATSKDDSRVGGLIKAVLSPGGAPFTQARITAVDAHVVDKGDLEFGFGCLPILGCLATVGVHTRTTNPDWLTLSLEKAGPAVSVSNGVFSQPTNSFRLKGVVDVDATGLAAGLITPGAQTMDTTGEIDLIDCQITASGSTLTLKMPVTYTGRFFLDPADTSTNYVDITVRSAFTGSGGFIVGVAPASANVPVLSDVATVTLHIKETNADGDSDGMPDAWESAHGLDPQSPADADSDRDGDGQSNRDEFLANTDPQDPSSVFAARGVAVVDGSISLMFSGLDPTRRYQLQASANLVTWSDTGGLITPAGLTHTVTVPLGPDGQFHRLRVASIVP